MNYAFLFFTKIFVAMNYTSLCVFKVPAFDVHMSICKISMKSFKWLEMIKIFYLQCFSLRTGGAHF